MDAIVEQIAASIPKLLPTEHRFLIAVAGPPASGKSTVANALVGQLGEDACGLVQMDAFHFDNAVLDDRGHRDRKGAPHTFDVAGLRLLLEALRLQPELEISVPRFDRGLELSRNCAAVIGGRQRIVVVEGNYLLANLAPWLSLAPLFDLTVSLDVPQPELEERILERWSNHGLNEAEAKHRWAANDGPNAIWVQQNSAPADVVLRLSVSDGHAGFTDG